MSQNDDENTDDGIWRATIQLLDHFGDEDNVSIPMTVFGGLQFKKVTCFHLEKKVSIPMTVFGGLQFDKDYICETFHIEFQYR